MLSLGSSNTPLFRPLLGFVLLAGVLPPAAAQTVRLDSGATTPFVDSAGRTWLPDRDYVVNPATTVATTYPATAPVAGVATAADAALYRSTRWAQLVYYRIPVPFRGPAVAVLKFAEFTATKAGARLMYVDLAGARVLNNFDVYKEAGGANVALDKTFRFNSTGMLEIVLYAPASTAVISALEIRPESAFISLSPQAATVASGASRQFSFTGTESAVNWTSTTGTISTTGLFRAPVVSSTQTVTITATSAASATVKTTATVTVTPPPPALAVTSPALVFSTVSGSSAAPTPAGINVAVSNAGAGILPFTAVPSHTWLRVSSTGGTAPAVITVSVNAAGLQAGSYAGKVTVAGAGTSRDLPVALTVTPAAPVLTVVPTAGLTFAAVRGATTAPAAQQITVSNSGGGTLAWKAVSDKAWLSVTPGTGNAPPAAALMVAVAPGQLPSGTHNGTVQISSGAVMRTVPVTFKITEPPALSVSPSTALRFTGAAGGNSTAAQQIQINNTGGGTLDWTATADQPWLSLSAAKGKAPAIVSVSANPWTLGVGTFTGEIAISGAGTVKKVPVTLTLTQGPNLTLAPSSLTFNARVGTTATARRVDVTNPLVNWQAATFPLNGYKPELEGQWQGITLASDGNVYFASSTHSAHHGAAFFKYSPATRQVTLLASDITRICGEDPNTNPQGKIHSDIVEANGWLYFSTHFSSELPGAVSTWTGSHLIGYQLATGQFRDYGVIHPRYTSYSAVTVDAARNYAYVFVTGMTPGEISYVYRINTVTGAKTNLGRVAGTYGTCLWMFADQRGDVWFASYADGATLRRIRGATGVIDAYPNVLPPLYRWDAEVTTPAPERGILWMKALDGDRAVFTLGTGGGMLYLFDSTQPIAAGSAAFRNLRHIGYTDLGLAVGNNRVYYYQRANRQYGHQDAKDFHLMSVSLSAADNYAITDHGLITDASGRLLWRAPAMAADPATARVFLVGDWWTLPGETGSLRYSYSGGVETYTPLPRGQFFAAARAPAPPASGPAVGWTVVASHPWISATPGSGSTPSSFSVSVNAAGLPAGTHSGWLDVTSGGITRRVPVTLVVAAP